MLTEQTEHKTGNRSSKTRENGQHKRKELANQPARLGDPPARCSEHPGRLEHLGGWLDSEEPAWPVGLGGLVSLLVSGLRNSSQKFEVDQTASKNS